MLEKPLAAIVNNEPTFRWTIGQLLGSHGFAVEAHDRSVAVVNAFSQRRPDVVVLETSYGSAVSATSIVERLRADRATRYVPILVCSPDGKFLHSYGEYLRGQGCVVIGRPFNDEQFIELVQRVVTVQLPALHSGFRVPSHQPLH